MKEGTATALPLAHSVAQITLSHSGLVYLVAAITKFYGCNE
jgi:hypothetical protein